MAKMLSNSNYPSMLVDMEETLILPKVDDLSPTHFEVVEDMVLEKKTRASKQGE